jgi:hydroxyethylthiazole kinase-like uncharacterized protein yjeF
MKLVNSSQMRNLDKKTIEKVGIPGVELMEKAGRGCAEVALEMLGGIAKGKKVLIFCGRGNNGGDGFVIGRYLKKWGGKVSFFLCADKKEVKGDAKTNLDRVKKLKIPIKEILQSKDIPQKLEADLIVDALFGTGFQGEITGYIAEVINLINSSKIPVLAVDIPSGLNADTGEFSTICIQAQRTVTMGLPKIGQFFFPGKSFCGKTTVVDIGIPSNLICEEDIDLNLITPQEVKKLLPQRRGDAYKGDCGKVFLLAGSTGLTGSAALASLSCLKAGAGMALLGIPQSLNSIMEVKVTEVMTKPLPDVKKKGVLALRGLGEINILMKWANCLAIGPGLGQHFETIELVQRLIKRIDLPTVMDADGLNALAKDVSILKQRNFSLILTPHIGELSRMNKIPIEEIAKDRIKYAKNFSEEYNCFLVFKGAPTIVAEPSGQVYVNSTGNPGMATAGSGDVLTGIIVGFLAQGLTPLDSAIAGVYIHGLAGDLACEEKGVMGLVASDIMEKIPEAILKLTK